MKNKIAIVNIFYDNNVPVEKELDGIDMKIYYLGRPQ